VVHHLSDHPSAEVSHHRVGVGGRDLISFPKEHLLDSSRWVGDYQHRLLLFLYDLEELRPRDLVPHFCSNPKSAYAVVRRLERWGVLRRVARGVYRVVKEVVGQLLRLPVRCIRGGARRGSAVRNRDGTTPASSVSVPTLSTLGSRAVATGSAIAGGSRYLGLFLDNLRWVGLDGRYRQLPRSALLRYGGLDPEWSVSYAEVTHVVGGAVLDGVVVVYTNVEDFRRFGSGTVRVEYRPPSGYVRRRGLASTMLLVKEELVKAFRALAVVLGEVLPRRKLAGLYSWLGGLWGVV
jgi:hypothetical protein